MHLVRKSPVLRGDVGSVREGLPPLSYKNREMITDSPFVREYQRLMRAGPTGKEVRWRNSVC